MCTAKGPRDRLVRLSAHMTTIQFYDVQDRLGYGCSSNAVNWLIKKAKAFIDELAELPALTPTPIVNIDQSPDQDGDDNNNQMGRSQNSRFLLESLDSVKPFFSTAVAVNNNTNNMNFPPANNHNNRISNFHCNRFKIR
ncbi:transcription factor TCP10-like [Bidens hawaiensis]|uniref:transcription factor TCP10-like n=1 Tax=Bidens hawaiensis TaxID=980011 RepID=UPI00404B32CC